MTTIIDQLKSELSYDPDTGEFRSLTDEPIQRYYPGDCIVIRYKKKSYRAHRLAWIFHYGEPPGGHILHVNGDPEDNSIRNLQIRDYGLNKLIEAVESVQVAKPIKTKKPQAHPKMLKWLRAGYVVEGNHLVLNRSNGEKTYILMYQRTVIKAV